MRKKSILSPREIEILKEACKSARENKGVDRAWIGEQLGISPKYVQDKISEIYGKLQVYDLLAAYFAAKEVYGIIN